MLDRLQRSISEAGAGAGEAGEVGVQEPVEKGFRRPFHLTAPYRAGCSRLTTVNCCIVLQSTVPNLAVQWNVLMCSALYCSGV